MKTFTVRLDDEQEKRVLEIGRRKRWNRAGVLRFAIEALHQSMLEEEKKAAATAAAGGQGDGVGEG
jgi:predicted transcriptional regulator